MSLWTPDGEHEVPRDRPAAARSTSADRPDPAGFDPDDFDPDDLSPEDRARLEEMAQAMSEVRQQLLSVPASSVVANHAIGFYELGAIHLSHQPPNLSEARVAIDAMGAVVEALEGRLGDNERALQDALAQIRLAFVQVQAGAGEGAGPTPDS